MQSLCRSCAASQRQVLLRRVPAQRKSYCTDVLNKHRDIEQGQLAKFRVQLQIPSPYIADYVYFRSIVATRERHFHK